MSNSISSPSLQSTRIVLVCPSHPGNIGAAARAMKTMGLNQLYLVNPVEFPSDEATSRASGADDVLANAQVVGSLQEALIDTTLVVGTTARERAMSGEVIFAHELSKALVDDAAQRSEHQPAIVFGRERTGLTNEEVDQCQLLVNVPTNPEYSSLNLGAAVQVLCYELRKAALFGVAHYNKKLSDNATETEAPAHPLDERADQNTRQHFYTHLERWMDDVGFLDKTNPVLIMRRLRLMFDRAKPTKRELNILRGALSATEQKLNQHSQLDSKEEE